VKPVLLLVDLQHDFLRTGNLEPSADAVTAAAAELLEACRIRDIPVIHVWSTVNRGEDDRMPHRRERGEWRCVEGTPGHECPEPLRPRKTETVIPKRFFSGFSSDQLNVVLNHLGADMLIIAGVHVHACIRATALDGYSKSLRVIIADDASGSDDPLHAAISRRYLRERSIRFQNVAEIICDLLGKSGTTAENLSSGDSIRHVSPSDPEKVWNIAESTSAEIERAAGNARNAFSRWRNVPIERRLEIITKWGDAIETSRNELVDLLVDDIGKPHQYAHGEVTRAVALTRAAQKQLELHQESVPARTGYRRVPHGVVGLVSPFNNPLAIPVGKLMPALLYGNVALWKPAVPGTRIGLKATVLFQQASGMDGLLQLVVGGDEAAKRVMHLADAVTLSGSLKAGWSAQEICAQRHIPLQAELGGNNASIVWRDADISKAATAVAEGAFVFAGQRCTANRRAVVDSDIYERFLPALISATRDLIWDDPSLPQTQLGPLISAKSRARVEAIVDRARTSLFEIIQPCIAPRSGAVGHAWFTPTIICCDEPGAEIVQEETFGPVLVIQRARSWDDAIGLTSGVRQGLAAAVFTQSDDLVHDFLARAQAGILKVNSSTADAAVDLPFGGWKASGVGPPEHGPANREFFTRMQSIYFA